MTDKRSVAMKKMVVKPRPKITLFHCINTFNGGGVESPFAGGEAVEIKAVKLPCSGMVKDVFLLRAFESGSDAVVVLTCPEERCRHLDGSTRAKKRVEYTKKLLDEIDFDGRRLSVCPLSSGDVTEAERIIRETVSGLTQLGPNPVKAANA
jgi:F420-non-reducing hydrogenase iron-sulfur subunit